jgi:branched-chain amino acid transport system ATP-binding protein
MIGRNGAGKTTTLLSIMGIARARRGAVKLGGEDITRRETHEIVRRGVGWVPEERRVLPNLTVLENLRLGMMAADRAGAEQRLE